MVRNLLSLIFFLLTLSAISQTKVSGIVVDDEGLPVPYASIGVRGTTIGTVTNEDGRFYLESDQTFKSIVVSFVGYDTKEVPLPKAVNYDFKIKLSGGNQLAEVKVYTGKTSKKNNPALDILRKIWERKRKNGLYMFDQYQMQKYEKVEFDMNSIDSAFKKQKIWKGMEFIFDHVDTSSVTGKTYLPIFINEKLSDVYGDNKTNKKKEIVKASKNSGFQGNQQIEAFIKDLYSEYNIYDNYLLFFDKSFTSPLSRTGIDVYNYVLADTAYIDNKRCFNIVFYPRRPSELTFKGDFWVADTTFAIKKITMAATKSANINWVKDIYIEQEFDVVNDSVFLLTKDYMMSDFAFSKREKSKGVYGKRTTMYRNHKFNLEKPDEFYKKDVNYVDESIYQKPDEYWDANRFEELNKDEKGVYKMLDTLKTVKKFKRIYNTVEILGSGYINYGKFDYGPIFSTFGYNDVEKIRLRTGGRTYFGQNDPWRLEGYLAYGFGDNKFKYGASGKWMIDKKSRVIISAGNRRDVEQIGVSLTTSNDVLGRSFASSSLFSSGSNGKLTNVNLTTLGISFEPYKNVVISAGASYRTLRTASETFSLDYYETLPTASTPGVIKGDLSQAEFNVMLDWTPRRQNIGYGVERNIVDAPYSRFFVNFQSGVKGILDSDFDYRKVQFYFRQPIIIGAIGRSYLTTEFGKTFGTVPLGLMSIIPGNQSYFQIDNTFQNLNYYEFLSDQYVTVHYEHNFQGKLFARVPALRKLNLREIIGFRGVYGTISDDNRRINASNVVYRAPEDFYYEYGFGIGNIFKVFRLDFSWRGNYLDLPDARAFAVKGSFGFYF
ncbi:DUF5686 and carboxypeptidase-like regulatory domain-containing protein [Flavobacterium silvaticum]|uniref:Carboxypeptidase-like regulatory domain-containing protein n=1 Tax=Flavobacterium silvaticum TaxID=1852020 RepID=A0A972JIF6_9FLAO|nr:DUF5686 and carboxypeptidase-like regulatory domain-containing protein [Flavobacterium silvaticum]NMH27222.1 carboxypeptidase-like regulatory domain-containing protein [Flavobacterium silvaticum]